ncbi:MAG: AbrB/MazE/SpoVT family DNA-binding domain-containing protein, partial [Candidatus Thermoplasmatota archaeon]|nr:AbrB/MazE/SpoVT family DNA-binding domain-containing protein [Candidatus Thermoplasmatota archaeon]
TYILTDNMSEVVLTKMSSKGQVVIPKALRELLDIKEGDMFAMFGENDTIIMKRVNLPSKRDLERILRSGAEHAKEKGITREDVQRAVEEVRKERKT